MNRHRAAGAGETRRSDGFSGFTLLEMLVVLAIIGTLAALSLPYMKGVNRSNSMVSATRQLLDDVSFARQRAISGRTTVFLVFMPVPDPAQETLFSGLTGAQRTNMITGQQVSYAMFTRRAIGEQPGQEHLRYLTKWHHLPEGVIIPPLKFTDKSGGTTIDGLHTVTNFLFSTSLPVPTITNGVSGTPVPYIAFDYQGRLVSEDGSPLMRDEYIPVTPGSIFFERDANGLVWAPADVRETPPNSALDNYNLIHIDWLTGRARVERLEVK